MTPSRPCASCFAGRRFVVETKSSIFTDDLRERENAKIKCGEAHFEALATGDNPARFVKATNLGDVMGLNMK